METMTATTTAAPPLVLTLSHRCDQCRAQAWTAWTHGDHGPQVPLLLCMHHANEHEPVLLAGGWHAVADQREALLAEEARPR